MSVAAVRNYLEQGFPTVAGWLSPRFMEVTAHLAEEMNAAGVTGGACEIGVYQGKFILGLFHAVDQRPSLAIDLFDNQAGNIDNSGGGLINMLEGFRTNVAKFGSPALDHMVANSFALTVKDQIALLDRYGPFQLFSIDGGHLAEHVVNDYRFAEAVTHHGGAIIFDDICNPGWPGVMEGVANILMTGRPKFVPLIMGENKLILVGLSYHKRYFAAMVKRFGDQLQGQNVWQTRFYGYEMLSLM